MSGYTRNYKTRTAAYPRLPSLQGCLYQGAPGTTRHALQLIPGSLLFRVSMSGYTRNYKTRTAAYPTLPRLQGCLCQGTPGTTRHTMQLIPGSLLFRVVYVRVHQELQDTHCSLSQAPFSSGLSMSGYTRNYKTHNAAYPRLPSLQGCLCQGTPGTTRHALQLIPRSHLFRVVYVGVHQELQDTHGSLSRAPVYTGLSMSGCTRN